MSGVGCTNEASGEERLPVGLIRRPSPVAAQSIAYTVIRRAADVVFALLAAPFVAGVALALITANPFLNPGPLFFRQKRMGKGGVPFWIWKFRTMLPSEISVRAHDAPLEVHRISALGRALRVTHIDELPNFINVLFGEMSIVGPRADAWDHAVVHIDTIPYYRERFRVCPGVTGLSQVMVGYADTEQTVRRKARLDHFYIRKSSLRLDCLILLKTVSVALTNSVPADYGARL